MAKTVKINGFPITTYLTPVGIKVSYKKILGNLGGVMLSGKTREDVRSIKSVIKVTALPLTEVQQSVLLSKVLVADSVQLYYYEPKTMTYRTIDASWEITETKERGVGADGNNYWTGITLTFTEL